MPLPKKLQNKKTIINVQNRDNQCLRWALRAALFPAPLGVKVTRTSGYPTEDGLNFAGIDFPTPVSQIVKLERQNPNLAINVFGWGKDNVTVHRISEKDGSIPRINLMVTQQGENTHYSYVKRLTALLYDQSKNSNSKHFCERCLRGYSRIDLLERHKPECKGQLKSPTRTEMPKEGENMVSFKTFHKQMKAPFVTYADFESVVRKLPGYEPSTDGSFTVKTEKHEACGFAYIIVRSDGATSGPRVYRGEDAVYKFLVEMLKEERWLRSLLEDKKPLVMTREDWQAHMNATECHICNRSLFKELFMYSMSVHDHDTGSYCGQSHRRCFEVLEETAFSLIAAASFFFR